MTLPFTESVAIPKESPLFNMASHVWVKVTDEGKRILSEHPWTKTNPPIPNAQGLTEMSLADVFFIFGDRMEALNQNPPIEAPFLERSPEDNKIIERNFNDPIWVEIYPEGEKMFKEYYKKLKLKPPELERQNGCAKMQMSDVGIIFGSKLNISFNHKDPVINAWYRRTPPK